MIAVKEKHDNQRKQSKKFSSALFDIWQRASHQMSIHPREVKSVKANNDGCHDTIIVTSCQ